MKRGRRRLSAATALFRHIAQRLPDLLDDRAEIAPAGDRIHRCPSSEILGQRPG
jgi:hypothetical protein